MSVMTMHHVRAKSAPTHVPARDPASIVFRGTRLIARAGTFVAICPNSRDALGILDLQVLGVATARAGFALRLAFDETVAPTVYRTLVQRFSGVRRM